MRNLTPILFALACLASIAAKAADTNESFQVNGKTFDTKSAAIRYMINLGKPVSILHTRCEILTNKLTLKACPKNKVSSFDNEQFKSIKESAND